MKLILLTSHRLLAPAAVLSTQSEATSVRAYKCYHYTSPYMCLTESTPSSFIVTMHIRLSFVILENANLNDSIVNLYISINIIYLL